MLSAIKERRILPRFDVLLEAQWEEGTTNYNVRIVDLSAGGCYVDSILEVSVGEVLNLSILSPSNKVLEVQGVVAHRTQGLGFGVRFVNVTESQRSQLNYLLKEIKPS